jgi:hypothetical protein
MSCNDTKLALLLERVGVTTARMQEVRSHGWREVESRLEQRSSATHGAFAEEIKIKYLRSPHPSPFGEGAVDLM